MMKQFRNEETNEYYYEGNSIVRKLSNNKIFTGIPNEEQLAEWGFKEIIYPEPSEEDLLNQAIENKLFELQQYDASPEVNGFFINGGELWLDSSLRQQLRTSIESYKALGQSEVTKYFNGNKFTFTIEQWELMLNNLEVYASEALNVTETHKINIQKLTSIKEVNNYDFTKNYPTKLVF